MTNAVLLENRAARVWRLDGLSANTSEALNVHCEILGVPLHRCPASLETNPAELLFVDLPGVNATDSAGLAHLKLILTGIGKAEVHLVLNGSYESSLQLAQVRCFSELPIHDLIVTHLDEETRWGKIWNLVLGTNYSIRALSAGQNIPGDFLKASAEEILKTQFVRK
jgi:flagellar biosynthesis GTPase FlhF